MSNVIDFSERRQLREAWIRANKIRKLWDLAPIPEKQFIDQIREVEAHLEHIERQKNVEAK